MHRPAISAACKIVFVAAVCAAICVKGAVLGSFAVLVVGVAAVGYSPRKAKEMPGRPVVQEFARWYFATGAFAAWVIVLYSLASLPAVTIALLIVSPLFGGVVVVIATT